MKGRGNFWRKYRWPWKCAERTALTEKLIHYFRQIPDYRCGREKRHDLAEMLVCITLGFLCGGTTPMLLNVIETVRGLILAQLLIDSKTNEITVIPELLKLLDISQRKHCND